MFPDIDEYLKALKESDKFGPQVVYHKRLSGQRGHYSKEKLPLPNIAAKFLQRAGLQRLYLHQQRSIEKVVAGGDILVATPTASGKSMIYNLPVLENLHTERPGCSLYLFPLKALAQDQHKVLQSHFALLEKSVQEKNSNFSALYDGDTSSYRRRKLRDNPPRILLTNPEMLHLSLLPYHENWAAFFSRLRYVVIDEVHSYRGVLGSHMAWVLRRLQRIAAYYDSSPQFILLSATIGNPEELGGKLLDRKIAVINESGAPSAEKNFLFLNPWDSAAFTGSQLLEAAVKRGLRTIVYTQSRKMTELINMWTAPRLGKLSAKLSAYRAGFLPEERREIEGKLATGELLGVISTSALELGIDIGDLDLCILLGYPGSIMATWQRGGRVGRAQRKSAVILIGQEDALDQHFMRHPQDFFKREPEAAVLNPENDSVMEQQLLCSASELPLRQEERITRSNKVREKIISLGQKRSLLETVSGGSWVCSRKYPQRHVSLRGGGSQLAIINGESGEIIGEIDGTRAMKECHPGAVYLHRATSWVSDKLDLEAKEVVMLKKSPAYYTRPSSEKQTEVLEVLKEKSSFGVNVFWGRLRVRERVIGYRKMHSHTQKVISTVPLDLPENIMETEGVWLTIPPAIVHRMEEGKYHFMGAIHAMEHGLIALFPLLVLCDRNDIGGISCPVHEQTESATVFVYDGYPGGVGLAREAFEKMDVLLVQTMNTISSCECETGCPSCVHSPKCGSGNRPIDKKACLVLLQNILDTKAEQRQKSAGARQIKQDLSRSNPSKSVKKISPVKGLDLLPDRYGVFDLETIRSAEEVGGWGRIDKMGLSLAVLYDSSVDEYVTYMENEATRLVDHLYEFDIVVGFNNIRFDNRVLSAYTDKNLNQLPSLDLLGEVQNQLGYRLSLNSLAEHTLGEKKSADGLQALRWYKEGRFDQIRKYCRKDVEITRDLFLHALERGFLIFANKAGQKVRLPLSLEEAVQKILTIKKGGTGSGY